MFAAMYIDIFSHCHLQIWEEVEVYDSPKRPMTCREKSCINGRFVIRSSNIRFEMITLDKEKLKES